MTLQGTLTKANRTLQAPLPLSLGLLVYEKEKRLRMMMRMHGLSSAVYIAVTYLYLILLYVVYVAGMMAIGAAVGLGFFRANGVGMLGRIVTTICSRCTHLLGLACAPVRQLWQCTYARAQQRCVLR